MNTLGHMFITVPIFIGILVYFSSIDEIKSHAVKDFSQTAFERGIMVKCEGYEGYFWKCQTQ
jgi:hypothetical protein